MASQTDAKFSHAINEKVSFELSEAWNNMWEAAVVFISRGCAMFYNVYTPGLTVICPEVEYCDAWLFSRMISYQFHSLPKYINGCVSRVHCSRTLQTTQIIVLNTFVLFAIFLVNNGFADKRFSIWLAAGSTKFDKKAIFSWETWGQFYNAPIQVINFVNYSQSVQFQFVWTTSLFINTFIRQQFNHCAIELVNSKSLTALNPIA